MRKSIRRTYAILSKKGGPGGIKCPCCCIFGCHYTKAKPLYRRYLRRVTKKEMENDEKNAPE